MTPCARPFEPTNRPGWHSLPQRSPCPVPRSPPGGLHAYDRQPNRSTRSTQNRTSSTGTHQTEFRDADAGFPDRANI